MPGAQGPFFGQPLTDLQLFNGVSCPGSCFPAQQYRFFLLELILRLVYQGAGQMKPGSV